MDVFTRGLTGADVAPGLSTIVMKMGEGFKKPYTKHRAEERLSLLFRRRFLKSLTESTGYSKKGKKSDSQPFLKSIFRTTL